MFENYESKAKEGGGTQPKNQTFAMLAIMEAVKALKASIDKSNEIQMRLAKAQYPNLFDDEEKS